MGATLSLALAATVIVGSTVREASAQTRPPPPMDASIATPHWLIDASVQDTMGTTVSVSALASSGNVVIGRGVQVSVQEFMDRVRNTNELVQRRFASDPAALESVVDRMLSDRLLAQEARRRGLESDPSVQAAVERALIARLRATTLVPSADARRVTEDEVRQFYDANYFRFHIPERRRVAVLFTSDVVRLERELRPWRRLNSTAQRRALRDLTREMTRDPALIAADYEISDVTEQRTDLDAGLRAAAFALTHENDISPAPVPGVFNGTRGVWIVRLLDRRHAVDRTLAESAEWIRQRLVLERRVVVEDELVRQLAERAGVRRTPAPSIVRVDIVAIPDAGLDSGLR
ncbi:MAG: peptidylprolyl isomerase [Deltaproteobacteria bacterium]|nr:peptidylprolyl isomerase [Deltaproteobacteria bacterium]